MRFEIYLPEIAFQRLRYYGKRFANILFIKTIHLFYHLTHILIEIWNRPYANWTLIEVLQKLFTKGHPAQLRFIHFESQLKVMLFYFM